MKQRTKDEWAVIIQSQVDGDLSIAQFCRQHKMSTSCFYKHKARLNDLTVPNSSTAFVKINRAIPTQSVIEKISIDYQQTKLNLPVTISPTWLAELMRALA